ncbi:hypothetical protein AUR64_04120 [Haloprofundus marisrubri]|uniref:Uncharacterized protein n=1 Tax=Haloprofundus marisrubri TaxID=1514971 RepID=A0A0W1RDE5_9EURY|nr:hypothetical protein AUR64_04120 [Haloprofundus marisrubri]
MLLTAGEHFGIRYIDGEWIEAIAPHPAPPRTNTLSKEDVVERIKESQQITLRIVDDASWAQFAQSESEIRESL